MKLQIDMPWERDLSVNHCRMGPKGNWHLKSHVESWMKELEQWVWFERRVINGDDRLPDPWPPDLTLPVKIVVDFRFPSNRKIDDHNLYYVIANSVAAGLGIDDKDLRISTGTVEVDRERPGFTITVSDAQND